MNAKFRLVLAAAVLLLAALLTPGTAMAQGTCDTGDLLELAAEADAAGYYGVEIKLAECELNIIFEEPSGTAPAVAPVSPLATPAAPAVPAASSPVAAPRMSALDYIQDDGEAVGPWVAPRIQLAIDASDMGLDTAALLYEAVANAQQMAADLGTTVLGGEGELPTFRDFRWLLWDATFNSSTVLPEYVETVFCLTFEGTDDQACLFLASAAFGDRSYANVDQVFAVR